MSASMDWAMSPPDNEQRRQQLRLQSGEVSAARPTGGPNSGNNNVSDQLIDDGDDGARPHDDRGAKKHSNNPNLPPPEDGDNNDDDDERSSSSRSSTGEKDFQELEQVLASLSISRSTRNSILTQIRTCTSYQSTEELRLVAQPYRGRPEVLSGILKDDFRFGPSEAHLTCAALLHMTGRGGGNGTGAGDHSEASSSAGGGGDGIVDAMGGGVGGMALGGGGFGGGAGGQQWRGGGRWENNVVSDDSWASSFTSCLTADDEMTPAAAGTNGHEGGGDVAGASTANPMAFQQDECDRMLVEVFSDEILAANLSIPVLPAPPAGSLQGEDLYGCKTRVEGGNRTVSVAPGTAVAAAAACSDADKKPSRGIKPPPTTKSSLTPANQEEWTAEQQAQGQGQSSTATDGTTTFPTERDIKCGRGKGAVRWPGNVRFRELIKGRLEQYTEANAGRVTDEVIRQLELERRRFLQQQQESGGDGGSGGCWFSLPDRDVVTKVQQAFRSAKALEKRKQKGGDHASTDDSGMKRRPSKTRRGEDPRAAGGGGGASSTATSNSCCGMSQDSSFRSEEEDCWAVVDTAERPVVWKGVITTLPSSSSLTPNQAVGGATGSRQGASPTVANDTSAGSAAPALTSASPSSSHETDAMAMTCTTTGLGREETNRPARPACEAHQQGISPPSPASPPSTKAAGFATAKEQRLPKLHSPPHQSVVPTSGRLPHAQTSHHAGGRGTPNRLSSSSTSAPHNVGNIQGWVDKLKYKTSENTAFNLCFQLWTALAKNTECRRIAVDVGAVTCIKATMQRHESSARIQSKACAILGYLAVHNAEGNGEIARSGVIGHIVSAMSKHEKQTLVVEEGCGALHRLASFADCRVQIIDCSGIAAIVSAMRRHRDVTKIQEYGCASLANLSSTGDEYIRRKIIHCGGVKAIIDSMRRKRTMEGIQSKACQVLHSLACDRSNQATLVAERAIPTVLEAMKAQRQSSDVQRNACLVLSCLAWHNPDNIVLISKAGGVADVLAAMKQHTSDGRLQREAFRLLSSLADPCSPERPAVLQDISKERRLLEVAWQTFQTDYRDALALP